MQKRTEYEPPAVIAERGWRFHHLGIPTDRPRDGEVYLEEYGMYVSGFETSPYGIEWMRFEADSPIAKLIQDVPHLAFEVDDLEAALVGTTRLGEISTPLDGIRVAMIEDNGAPVELMEIRRPPTGTETA